jgi:group I intron endonuclease
MKTIPNPEERLFLIYLVINTVNGKRYVGQTCEGWKRRWDLHCWKADNDPREYFTNAIKKHGKDSFLMEELEWVRGLEAANQAETFYISLFDTMDRTKGYNLTSGGNKGFVFSDETRERISRSQKALNRKMSPERKAALRETNSTRERTREERLKTSKAHRKLPTAEVHRLYLEEGLTTYEVAEKLGTTQSSVWSLLKFDGVPTRPNKEETLPQYKREVTKEMVSKMYLEDKLSLKEIAKFFGVSRNTITLRLKKLGIPRRSRMEGISLSVQRTRNHIGERIKNYVVLDVSKDVQRNKKIWLCKCDCGREQWFTTDQLTSGKVTSCRWHKLHPLPSQSSAA